MKKIKSTSRTFEQILGVLGSFISIISGSFIIFIESGGMQGNSFIAVLSIIGAILGFISVFYVDKDLEFAGVGFIVAAILVLMGTPRLGILGSVLILIAGMSALFRK
ncbi:hypothetical protein [Methanobrevibacter millerae]|uniref:Uncharacterized protein n=1 Tax=Methanobrevibacter millerae TaxID=230361 RepID=A0A1G5XSP7_9EURY|nr:hypothetical protein [Methanobrevibacter millerae]SDA72976.1 hypothetical protein SAMN02910315_02435 [Methanobrevibacter millerae]